MMTRMIRRILVGLILCMIAALSCGFTHAYADEGGIQLDGSGTYDVYCLLSGESHSFSYDTSFPASAWEECGLPSSNAGLSQDELSAKLKDSPEKVALEIAQAAQTYGTPIGTAASDKVLSLSNGYYIMVGDDIAPSLVLIEDEIVTVAPKGGVPTLDKEIMEDGSSYGKHALTESSESKPYRLTGTLPPNYDSYETYWYKFTDVMKPSLELDVSSPIIVKAVLGPVESDISDQASISYEDGTLTVSFEDLKQSVPEYGEGVKVLVEYGAKLVPGEYGTGGANPQVNTAYLEYSSYMSPDGKGRTTDTKTESYTFALNIRKVDNVNKETLSGAEFVLTDEKGKYRTAAGQWSDSESEAVKYTTDSAGTVSIAGLSAGRYSIVETKAPVGYVKPDKPIDVLIEASLDAKVHLSASVIDSGIASVTSVSAADGTVDMVIENPKQKYPPSDESNVNSDEQNKKTNTSVFDIVPKLGEHPIEAAIIAVVAAAVVVIAVRNRKSQRKEKGSKNEED